MVFQVTVYTEDDGSITLSMDDMDLVVNAPSKEASIKTLLWGDRIFEKCGIRRDEEGDGGKTLEIRGKRRLSARDGGANYQQS